jgi:hypothetical protein
VKYSLSNSNPGHLFSPAIDINFEGSGRRYIKMKWQVVDGKKVLYIAVQVKVNLTSKISVTYRYQLGSIIV